MKKYLSVGLSFVLLTPLAAVAKNRPLDNVWVVVKPVQCLGNPWEKNWLAAHKNKGWQYPRDKEKEILKNFFKKRGVQILEIRIKPFEKPVVCETCACPRGDTLFLLVGPEDSLRMAQIGYTERVPEQSAASKHGAP